MEAKKQNLWIQFFRELKIVFRSARKVWRLIPRKHKLALGLATAFMALTSACNVALPVLLGRLVDRSQEGVEQQLPSVQIYRIAAIYLGLIGFAYFLRELLQVIRRYLVENTCTRMDRDLGVKVVSHLLRVDLANITQERVGALHGRISRSVDGFVRFVRLGFLNLFPALLTGLFALGTSLAKEPRVGLAMAGVIPTSLFLTIWQLVSQKGVRLKLMRSREELDATVVEQLGGIDYVRASNTHKEEIRRFTRTAENRRSKEIRHHFEMSLFGCAKALTEGLFHIFVLTMAIYLAVSGRISLGDVLIFSVLFMNVMTPISEIHRVLDEAHEASLQVSDLLKLLAESTDASFNTPNDKVPALVHGRPAIVVENLQVEYVTALGQRRRALDGIGMTICHGEKIGVAGKSGGGKSTWIKVLLRLVHPSAGTASVGGVPLEEFSRDAIADCIGYVAQNPFSFAGTISENIAYGCGKPSREAIENAARQAFIHDEIIAMPDGYDAKVMERGSNLSGGQRQRIALARLFLKTPPILILDEGTSALDNISERNIQRALAEARADSTVIHVAHRLSTLRDADRIYVFDGGRIAEVGTYQELFQHGGVFSELVMSAEQGMVSPQSPPTEEKTAQMASTTPLAAPERLEPQPVPLPA